MRSRQMLLKRFDGNSSVWLKRQQGRGDALHFAAQLPSRLHFLDVESLRLHFKFSPVANCSASALFQHLKLLGKIRPLVVVVQGIASGGQAFSRGGRAITKSSTYSLVLDCLTCRSVPKQLRIGQHHAAQSDRVHPPFTHCRLRHVRKKILQVTVSRSNEDEIWKMLLQRSSHFHLPSHIDQRVLGRLIPIGRRKKRRPLNVRAVIWATRCEIGEWDLQLRQERQKQDRL